MTATVATIVSGVVFLLVLGLVGWRRRRSDTKSEKDVD